MSTIPQLNDTMPIFKDMKPIAWGIVMQNLLAYFLKRMVDVSGYALLIIILATAVYLVGPVVIN